ncbi:putative polysaccharide biosynthesis protein [Saliterribacillus persicus]|nr:polysaccharide biosynthesis protein [Saliterribacillus persicus]
MSANILRGTLLLTGASFLSKLLGMLYVIPFENIVKEEGMALYSFAYVPYTIFLSISTIGIPLAVSKFVSKYNAIDDYYTSKRMFQSGIILMFCTGFLAFLIMFFGAETIARWTIAESNKNFSILDAKQVIQMVSFSLLIIPGMAVVRGFFQGNQSMGPTAISQVVEQIARIIFLLVAVFIIVVLLDGSITTAVGFATFSAFIGGIASWIVLGIYWKQRKQYINEKIEQQKRKEYIPTKTLFKELLSYAGPFVLVGIAIPLYQIIDQFTYSHAMASVGLGDIWEIAYSSFNMQGHKLVIIPVTVATGLSLALVPEITKSFNISNKTQLTQQINQAFQIILFFVLPAIVGLMLLSYPAYGALFGLETIAISGPLLTWYAPVALFFALFTVSAAILQGIEKQRFTLISLSAGILLKILFNTLFIQTFGANGAIIATMLGTLVAVSLNLWKIKSSINFSYKQTIKRGILMLIFTSFMALVIVIVKWVLGFWISYDESRLHALTYLLLGVGIGGMTYLWLGYASTLFERVVDRKIGFLDRIFRR